MKIATFNVNGITARLPSVLCWLEESRRRARAGLWEGNGCKPAKV
jgi:hypothetical protein